ncbi:transcriptional regulator [Arenicella chitinivorans]|uniref:Transcriptional regulator n=1 Tax=Arenicella chitinivorans TaxID=1329800 RepID=A0A918RV23_9GAMM|nr:metalloregulator ArsR/SmtB family transcription factor [Arenicella chitinivorans]GHA10415.1 transcriptional regulator [Arenicella chitinivorans]
MNPLQLFKCLADDTRLKLVLLVATRKEVCVCDLTDALDLEQPKISRHLAELRNCQVLYGERRGRWVYYQLDANLPSWAQTVIQTTLANNGDFFQEARERLTKLCC